MWKFDKQDPRALLRLRPRTLALTAAAALLMPVVAISGIVGTDEDKAGVRKPAGYNLRCWQDGKLILEETYVTLPKSVDVASAKLQVMDRNNMPMYVTETRNATCLVQARVERERSGFAAD
ncbi:MAG TPA: hypothetical protein VFR86_13125 [Burkholderiaceae bacterium]|nr:hypothetical protein [Burkholderiaceae bacterium]